MSNQISKFLKSPDFKLDYARWKEKQGSNNLSGQKHGTSENEVEHEMSEPTSVTSNPSNSDEENKPSEVVPIVQELIDIVKEYVGMTQNLTTIFGELKTEVQAVDARVKEMENTRTMKKSDIN